jgi:uncharacterized protein with GYD domain
MPLYVLLMNLTERGVDALKPAEDSEGREFAAFEESLEAQIEILERDDDQDNDNGDGVPIEKRGENVDDAGVKGGGDSGENGGENLGENGGEDGAGNGGENGGAKGGETVGGLRALFWTLGGYDVVAIVELESDLTAAAVALWLAQTHGVRTTTMPAFTRAEVTPGEDGANVIDSLYRCHFGARLRRTEE